MSDNKLLEEIKNQHVYSKMELLGWSRNHVSSRISAQKVSKKMAKDLEKCTGVDVKFWLFPGEYDVGGNEL